MLLEGNFGVRVDSSSGCYDLVLDYSRVVQKGNRGLESSETAFSLLQQKRNYESPDALREVPGSRFGGESFNLGTQRPVPA